MAISPINTAASGILKPESILQKEAEKNEKAEKEEAKKERYDRYLKGGEDSDNEAPGIYSISEDEDGNQRVQFDSPEKVNGADKNEAPESNDPEKDTKKADGEKPVTVNTDKVDREIKKLKDEKKSVEQKLSKAEDEKERRALENKLNALESELAMKDNDSYRKANAVWS